MQKLLNFILLFVVLLAVARAIIRVTPVCAGHCTSVDLDGTERICIRNTVNYLCTKIRPCKLRELNCARWNLGEPRIWPTIDRWCRRDAPPDVEAECERLSHPYCRSCIGVVQPASCWKDRVGRVFWLSKCVAELRNCSNNWDKPHLQLKQTDNEECAESK